MFGRTVGALALVALGAQAFLLPPGMADKDSSLSALAIDTTSQSIKLPCSECIFPAKQDQEAPKAEEADDTFSIQGGANDVELTFAVAKDGLVDILTLNGETIYPIEMSPEQRHHVIQTSKVPVALEVTGDAVFGTEEIVSPEGDMIVSLVYQIASLEKQPVTLDAVNVQMLKGSNGDLSILSINAMPSPQSLFDEFNLPPVDDEEPRPEHEHKPEGDRSHHPHHHKGGRPHHKSECNSMMPSFICKLKHAIEAKIHGMRKHHGSCSGKKGGKNLSSHIKGKPDLDSPKNHHGRPPHHMRPDGPDGSDMPADRPERPEHPHHHSPHHGHHGHHRHHRGHFLHKLLKGFVMVLVPIMAGMTMGMTVSLLGMLVGRLIGYLWIKFRRGGQRGYASVAQQEDSLEAATAEKGAIVLEEESRPSEDLPAYEHAPEYVEIQGEEKK